VAEIVDAIVIGAGAAGLMCAIEAGKRGRTVVVIEHNDRIGRKILISGGGRCNFTNLHCRPENFLSANPHFAKSALARYTPADFVALLETHRIPYHEKTLGQLFCDRSATDVTNMLEEECRRAGVRILLKTRVNHVSRDGEFVVDGMRSRTLIIATGGLSIPKMGATSFGYDIARQFGLRIKPCRPALVPLTWNADDQKRYADLAGVSAEVIASADGVAFHEKMLFTHRGLSGPAILQASSYWRPREPVGIDVAPGHDLTYRLRESPGGRDIGAARAAFREVLAHRLADRWVDIHAPSRWTTGALTDMERKAHRWEVIPAGPEGYVKAEVTAGGVDTDELSAKTMESRKVPGLFFVGEVVDVTGHLGGFNFQWAWASGYCAGQAIAS
jgi:predicted Rossmann fold flavoprotein